MPKYVGSAVRVDHGTADLSGQYTTFEWKTTQGEAKRENVSDKSSTTSEEFVTGLLGDKKTTWSVKANDVVGGTSKILTLTLGLTGTVVVYSEGKVHSKPKVTILSGIVNDFGQTGGYATKVELSASGYSFSEPTFGTYSST